MAAVPYPDRDGFIAELLSEMEGPPSPVATIELRGGHVVAQQPGILGMAGVSESACACGLTPAQIEAYGYPTCPASDIIDSTAVELPDGD